MKLNEYGIKANLNTILPGTLVQLRNFSCRLISVNHSVPDTTHVFIKTQAGNFYHGSDFKFDLTPLDNKKADFAGITRAGEEGVVCLLSDCLGSERKGVTLSERVIEDTIEEGIRNCQGKFIFTTQSSNISRIQQAINVSIRNNRKRIWS